MALPEFTHIVEHNPHEDNRLEGSLLFRADSGIRIGQRIMNTVVYGDYPNKNESRVFIDATHAERFISELLPALDLTTGMHEHTGKSDMTGPAKVDHRHPDSKIIRPFGVMDELPAGIKGFGHKV